MLGRASAVCSRLGAATDSVSCSSRNFFTDTSSNTPTAGCPDVSLQGTPSNSPTPFFWSRGGLVEFERLTHVSCRIIRIWKWSEPTVMRAEFEQMFDHQNVENIRIRTIKQARTNCNYSQRYSHWDHSVSVGNNSAKALEEIGISQRAIRWLVYVHEFRWPLCQQ